MRVKRWIDPTFAVELLLLALAAPALYFPGWFPAWAPYAVFGALVAGCAAVAALASAGFALLFGSWLTGKLGGLTGDMYGAAAELAEVVALLAFILSAYIK